MSAVASFLYFKPNPIIREWKICPPKKKVKFMIPPLQLYGFFPICLIEPDWVPWDYYPEQFLDPKFIFWSKKSSQLRKIIIVSMLFRNIFMAKT